MNWLKTSLLLCGCLPLAFAEEAVEVSENAPRSVISEAESNTKMSDNLTSRNPFIPFKIGKSATSNFETSSDFDFLSVVVYPDHQEFSLKEKTKDKPFWLSSDNRIKDENYGLIVCNYDPLEKELVVRDTISGNLNSLRQKEFTLTSAKTGSSSFDWSSLLSGDDDDDDDDDIASLKISTKGKK
ncbi:MAG: hypothetical protein ACSW8C_01475 [bacterium]